ncbi:MAG: sugar phosphate nucleotidyltransferase, partial [Raoultibacter sp.]
LNTPALAILDDGCTLRGLFTNGDMRKFFLSNGDLQADIEMAMNSNPACFYSIDEIKAAQVLNPYIAYPLVDSNGKLVDLVFDPSRAHPRTDDLSMVPLVIMAGGKGTRLYPYTKILPKALVPIGEKTVSERIIDQFYQRGCRDVFFVLNHKAGMVRAYFDDIDRDYDVHYVEESEFLGTGGGLSLLKGQIDSTFILSNCDIIINDDLSCAYRTHCEEGNLVTFICAMINVAIPYGVVKTDNDGVITSMEEKPKISCLANTGVYIVEPQVLDMIRENEFVHFPMVAERLLSKGERVGVFPVSEKSWIDIGELTKMNNAIKQFDREPE